MYFVIGVVTGFVLGGVALGLAFIGMNKAPKPDRCADEMRSLELID